VVTRVLLDEGVPRHLAVALEAALKEVKPRQYVVIETDGSRSVLGFDEQGG
jgi:hypothetical protein